MWKSDAAMPGKYHPTIDGAHDLKAKTPTCADAVSIHCAGFAGGEGKADQPIQNILKAGIYHNNF